MEKYLKDTTNEPREAELNSRVTRGILKQFSILLILTLVMLPYSINSVRSQDATGKYVKGKFIIVIDEGHGGVFNYKDFLEFLKQFNESFYNEEGLYIKVYSIKGKLNSSLMIGVDLLIIPPTNGSIPYTSEEGRVLLDYLKTGGGVLILGAPFNIESNGSPDVSYLNDLLIYMKQDISFYYETGSGDLIRDDINGEGDIIYLDRDYADQELEGLFNNVSNSIKVSTCSIDFRQRNNTYAIKTRPTSYRVNSRFEVYYNNSGYNVLVARKIDFGILTITGFGEIFTNITSNYNEPWMSIASNFQFAYNLIKWMLRLDRWVLEEKQPMHPLHIYLLVASVTILAIYPLALRIDEKRRKKIEEKKREVKISEILKKVREKEKK